MVQAESVIQAGEPHPLTRAQRRIWMLYQLNPDTFFYNISLVFDLEGSLDLARLEQSIRDVLRRHRVLRAVFCEIEGQPMQVASTVPDHPLAVKDLREGDDLSEELAIQEFLHFPFKLASEPPFRAMLIRRTEDRCTLILVLHHIATDMWSMDIICRELSQLYNATVVGKAPQLGQISKDYFDFARWEHSEDHKRQQGLHLQYWREKLASDLSLIDLPYDYRKSSRRTFNGGVERIGINRQTFQGFRALCRTHRITLFNGLFAAYVLLLHRLTGQSEILVGTFLANRHQEDTEPMIGLLFNDLPLLVPVDRITSFEQLLRQTQREILGALSHADCAIEDVLHQVQPGGAGNPDHPFYNVTFQLYHRNEHRLSLEGVEAHQRRVFQGAKFDLMFYGSATDNDLEVWFNFNTDLFKASTIRRLLGYFDMLLQSIVDGPQRPIGDLDFLTPIEKRRLLFTHNASTHPYPSDRCIPQLLEAQAAAIPERLVLSTDPSTEHRCSMSYYELNAAANRLAWLLRERGIGRETPVGVLLERSSDMVIADLAILKAGGACVLLDANYPPSRNQFMLQQANAQFVVTTPCLSEGVLSGSIEAIDVHDESLSTFPIVDLPSVNIPSDTAFVVFTSGSTGQPKGVMLSHRGVTNQVHHRLHKFNITRDDKLCLSLSVAFSTLPLQLLTPLIAGCELVVYQHSTVANPQTLMASIDRDGVTLIEVTVSALAAWLRTLRREGNSKPAFDRLRIMLTAGEKLLPSIVQEFYENYSETTLVTTFGQSECTGIIASAEVPRTSDLEVVAEGYPSINNRIYVLDQYLQPTPPGIRGTVFFAGDSVANGYINAPQETKRTFSADPFAAGGTMVNTGDQAIRLEDGRISVVGRKDLMVKVRGNRVELQEVERALRAYPDITEGIVAPWEEPTGEVLLAAYFTSTRSVDDTALRRFLHGKLPSYMIPSFYVPIEAVPLNLNQKVDRRALPDPRLNVLGSQTGETPRTDTERNLAALWQEVLRVVDVRRTDNFFASGGHSLRAMELVAKILSTFKVEVPVHEVFLYPTLEELAGRIEALATQEEK